MYIQTRIKSGNPPKSGEGIRLAICQPRGGLSGSKDAIAQNLKVLQKSAKIARDDYKAQIISFPELFLCGYAFESNEVAYSISMSVEEISQIIAPIAKEVGIAILCPYPQKDIVEGKERYYDAMVLIDENGNFLRNYKKTHLWGPGEQDLWSFGYAHESEGEAYTVVKVNDFPIGVLNCYEAEFPELSRIYATKGAKLVVIPTAADAKAVVLGKWTTKRYPDISKSLIPARSLENGIFVAYNNYTGMGHIIQDGQRSDQVEYLGNSIIADPYGEVMSAARNDDEVLLIADCIPGDYPPNHPCPTNYIKDRRPALYDQLVKQNIECDDWKYPTPPKPIYEDWNKK